MLEGKYKDQAMYSRNCTTDNRRDGKPLGDKFEDVTNILAVQDSNLATSRAEMVPQ